MKKRMRKQQAFDGGPRPRQTNTVRGTDPVVTADGWDVPMPRRLMGIEIDRSAALDFEIYDDIQCKDSTRVRIGNAFDYEHAGRSKRFDPQHADELGPILTLVTHELKSARILSSGQLHLVFDDGRMIRVPPDPQYEAWEIVGPGKRLIVCMPGGGEPAIWTDHSPTLQVTSDTPPLQFRTFDDVTAWFRAEWNRQHPPDR